MKSFNINQIYNEGVYQLIEAEWHIYALVILPSLVQIMACCLDGTKPLSEPILDYLIGHLETIFSNILI